MSLSSSVSSWTPPSWSPRSPSATRTSQPDRRPQHHDARAGQPEAGAGGVGRSFPPFMRRANTTFVNLRAALERRRSAGGRLGAGRARSSARSSPRRGRRRRRRAHDQRPARRRTAHGQAQRPGRVPEVGAAAGGHRGGDQASATARSGRARSPRRWRPSGAARRSSPPARPYTQDFLGWFDDFSTTGGGFDASALRPRPHHLPGVHPDPALPGPGRGGPGRAGTSSSAARAPPRRRPTTGRTCCPARSRSNARLRRSPARDGERGMRRLISAAASWPLVCAGAAVLAAAERRQAKAGKDVQDRLRQRLRPHRGRRLPGRRRERPGRPREVRGHQGEGLAAQGRGHGGDHRARLRQTSARTRRATSSRSR